MPRGKTHDQIALISLVPTFIAGLLIFKSAGAASVLTLSTIVSALLFSPDLDTKSSNYYRWGLFRFIWLPYRKLITHRSRFSHSFFIAPIVKLAYLSLLTIVALLIFLTITGINNFADSFFYFNESINSFSNIQSNYLLAIIAGYFWANSLHLFADYSVSYYKKLSSKL